MSDDLKKIKKYYGEEMMHFCRSLFPTLIEKNLLFFLMHSHFYPSKYLYCDIVNSNKIDDFRNYIYGLLKSNNDSVCCVSDDPYELLDRAGYILYECKTEEDIQSFKKYYAEYEELCTFRGGRLKICKVFFAIKKNVDMIRREDFPNPVRDDLYGTSVISIQFTKGKFNMLSIKNRYNHFVENPDATFSNNLDNIIPGLTKSFENKYNLHIGKNIENDFELPNYIKANDGKYYKYNYEINGIYYCPDNIIIDNFNVVDCYHKEKERYILLDYFILDLKEKKMFFYDNISDCFLDSFNGINKIQVENNNGFQGIKVFDKCGNCSLIFVDMMGKIIYYRNDSLIYTGDSFLFYNSSLIELDLPNLEYAGDYFLFNNECLNSFDLSSIKQFGDYFCYWNNSLKVLNFPNLERFGYSAFYNDEVVSKVSMPLIPSDMFCLLNFLNKPDLQRNGNKQLIKVIENNQ